MSDIFDEIFGGKQGNNPNQKKEKIESIGLDDMERRLLFELELLHRIKDRYVLFDNNTRYIYKRDVINKTDELILKLEADISKNVNRRF